MTAQKWTTTDFRRDAEAQQSEHNAAMAAEGLCDDWVPMTPTSAELDREEAS